MSQILDRLIEVDDNLIHLHGKLAREEEYIASEKANAHLFRNMCQRMQGLDIHYEWCQDYQKQIDQLKSERQKLIGKLRQNLG